MNIEVNEICQSNASTQIFAFLARMLNHKIHQAFPTTPDLLNRRTGVNTRNVPEDLQEAVESWKKGGHVYLSQCGWDWTKFRATCYMLSRADIDLMEGGSLITIHTGENRGIAVRKSNTF